MRKFLLFFFHILYHPMAWSYDFVAASVSLNRWAQWRSTAMVFIKGTTILELGFGTGHLQVELMNQGFKSFGLDESRQMADIARKNIMNNKLQPALTCGIAQNLPFANESLDGCVATFPSEYIIDTRTLSELRRVLKPNGRIVIIPTAWLGGSSLPDKFAKWLFRITGQTVEITERFETRIKLLFDQAGFEVNIHKKPVKKDLILVIIAEKSKSRETI